MMLLTLAIALCVALLAGPAGAAGSDEEVAQRWGLRKGAAPPRIGAPPAGMKDLSAASCEDCHAAEAAEWRGSGHRQSWTRPLFQRAYALEPMAECRNCHQPLSAGRRGAEAAVLRAEGITCAVCHVRGGEVLSASRSGRAPHAVRAAPLMAQSAFCGGCHQFPFPEHQQDGRVVFSDEPMQDTLAEWQRAGGSQTCQGCHMPQVAGASGRRRLSHRFLGGHDSDLLRQAVSVSAALRQKETGTDVELQLQASGGGHSVPTGDLYRSLVVEAELLDQAGQVLASAEPEVLTRRFSDSAEAAPSGGVRLLRRQVMDGRLQPGELRRVTLALPVGPKTAAAVRYRVSLHRLPPGAPPSQDAMSEIAAGLLPLLHEIRVID